MNELLSAVPTPVVGVVPCTVSVVICCYTLDRWADLTAALESLEGQAHRPHEVIVVVDHNDELLSRVRSHVLGAVLPVTVASNTGGRGLSGARNRGVALASGDCVAFLDDDAVPADAQWLGRIADHYDGSDVWGVGGSATPEWGAGGIPAWFPIEYGWVVGCSYRGQPRTTAPVRNLLGCNMSFRRDLFEELGGFTEGIGRVGTKPVGCEETELCIRLRQAHPCAQVLYDPDIRVHHRVTADRRSFGYFLARCRAEGASKAQVAASVGAEDALASERAYVARVLPSGVLRGLGDAVRGDLHGLQRAAAILIGLTWTVAGYVPGRLTMPRSS